MSLRRADPARGSRRYDRGMPVTQGDGRPHWDGRWDGRPDRFRPPPGGHAPRPGDHQPARAGARRDRHRRLAPRRVGGRARPGRARRHRPARAARLAAVSRPDGRRRVGRRPRRPPAHPRCRAALRGARVRDRARASRAARCCGPSSPWSSGGWRRSCWAPWSASTGIRSASRSRRPCWRRASASARSCGCAASAPRSSARRRCVAARRPSSASACASRASCTT